MRLSRRALLATGVVAPGLASVLGHSQAQIDADTLPGKIAFVRNGGIWQVFGGRANQVLSGDNISDARWSPDGSSLLYVRTGNSYSDLFVLDSNTGTETALTTNQSQYDVGSIEYAEGSSWALDPDWSRSGLIGFVSDKAGVNAPLALWLISSVNDQPYQALDPGTEEDIFDVCLAADGSFAGYTVRVRTGDGSSGSYVALRDLNTGDAGPIAESSGDQFQPAISPDGLWIAFTIRDKTGVTDLWIVERATANRSRLTRSENAMSPRWSDDGQWLAYLRLDGYNFAIWAGAFSSGRLRNQVKIYGDSGIDAQSGLSWWVDLSSPASPTATQST